MIKVLLFFKCNCCALQATELRLAGNAEARGGDLRRAVELYTQVCSVDTLQSALSERVKESSLMCIVQTAVHG